jgi:hypothetical protein
MHLHSLIHLLLIYCGNIMIEFFNVFLLNLILKFFCKYVENNIFGFFINSNFNEKENLKELFPYSDKNIFFNCFLLMIIQLLFLH